MSRYGKVYTARDVFKLQGQKTIPMAPEQEIPEREQRVADLLRQARVGTRAPEGLRAQVGALREGPARHRRAARPTGLPSLRVGLAGFAAVVVAALVIALSGGSTAAPSLVQVAALAGRGPAVAAPGPLPSAQTTLLTASVGGLHFPNWRAQGRWRSSGERTDTIDGRTVKTVFYTNAVGTRLAYSIVASPVLWGSRVSNSPYVWLQVGSRTAVVWTDQGHTCALSGVGISGEALWRLAKTTLD
jgi:hypothetical protein